MNSIIAIIAMIIFLAFTIITGSYLNAWQCERRWAESGIESEWSYGAGCQVRYKGAWIPEERYRVVEE